MTQADIYLRLLHYQPCLPDPYPFLPPLSLFDPPQADVGVSVPGLDAGAQRLGRQGHRRGEGPDQGLRGHQAALQVRLF